MLALRLPEDIEIRLDKLAKATGRTKSFYAREAILEHLADMEDLYLAEKSIEQNPQWQKQNPSFKKSTGADQVARSEQHKHPSGPSLKLLSLLERKGLVVML
jgi:RHH-type rel operon transcriptional repressor/antitoxin RelB